MDHQTEELIRQRAFELSLDPGRTAMTDIDNWLEAERLIQGGLHEAGETYAPAQDLAPASGTGEASAGDSAANDRQAASSRNLRRAS